MTNNKLIKNGNLTVSGENADGQEVVLEAPVKDFEVIVEEPDRYLISRYRDHTATNVTFKAELADNSIYTARIVRPRPVEHTARVEVGRYTEAEIISGLTPKDVQNAVNQAGVEDTTVFDIVFENDIFKNQTIAYIEFRWTD